MIMALNKTQFIFWYIDQHEFTINTKPFSGLIYYSYLFGSEFQVFNYIYDILQSYNPEQKPQIIISTTAIKVSNSKKNGKGIWSHKDDIYINAYSKPHLSGKRIKHYIDLTSSAVHK